MLGGVGQPVLGTSSSSQPSRPPNPLPYTKAGSPCTPGLRSSKHYEPNRAHPSIVYWNGILPLKSTLLHLLPSFLDGPHPLHLPNLRKITSDTSMLALLIPGRPVTNVVLTVPWPMTRANEQVSELDDDDKANIAWQDRRQLEELAAEEQAEVFRGAYALSHSTGPVRRVLLPLVLPSN